MVFIIPKYSFSFPFFLIGGIKLSNKFFLSFKFVFSFNSFFLSFFLSICASNFNSRTRIGSPRQPSLKPNRSR